MGDEFRALQKRLGITSLYVMHDQEEAMALSDRVVVMQNGRILQVGTPEEIYQRPVTRAVAAFFGSPNLLDARVTGCARGTDNKFELAVAGVNWSGHCLAGEPFATGEPVLVLVRPENMRVDGEGTSGPPMAWSAALRTRFFVVPVAHGGRNRWAAAQCRGAALPRSARRRRDHVERAAQPEPGRSARTAALTLAALTA